ALVAEGRDLARADPEAAERMLKLADGSVEGIEGRAITQAALEGDPAALECFASVADWTGRGLADLAAILDPECFIVGGGVSDAGDILIDPVRLSFARNVSGGPGRRLPPPPR
ncbi:ROK family protein, partial [Nocardiopsis salina]|uniref:ROK family protein n=1 Tax=Nocardiopsis salina TaxID=245836 RepID=UPI00037CB7EE